MILTETFLGARIWIWLLLIFVIGVVSGTVGYYFRELLKGKYYRFRWKERAIKVVIHYPSNMYKEFWRIIPTGKTIEVEKLPYRFDPSKLNKYEIEDDKIEADNSIYSFDKNSLIKHRYQDFKEIHYYFNDMEPIDFSNKQYLNKVSSEKWDEFVKNDLLGKLLTIGTQGTMIMLILIAVVLNILITGFLLAKEMGWLQ